MRKLTAVIQYQVSGPVAEHDGEQQTEAKRGDREIVALETQDRAAHEIGDQRR
jgi:hypothetical protein